MDVQQTFADALAHHQAGRLQEAEQLYRRILALDSRHADALHLLGVIAQQVGRSDAAVELIDQAIALNGSVAAYHSNLAAALTDLGRLDDALQAGREAIRLQPDYAEAHYNQGNVFKDLGRPREAIAAYQTAIGIRPDYARAQGNLAIVLIGQGRYAEAVAACEAALRAHPDYADAYANLGAALKLLGRAEEAAAAGQAAIHLKPDHAEAHANLGAALTDLGRLEEAVVACQTAIRLKPDYAEARANLGTALKSLGRLDEAVAVYRDALGLKPDYAEAHYNLAFPLFLRGELEAGFREFEWRWRGGPSWLRPRGFVQPQWTGEDLSGRIILLHAEQGMGDTIQFCRYAPLVAARGAKVVLEAPRPLLRLLSTLAGVEQLVAVGDPLPDFDVHCPLMSLPWVFGTALETIPADVPYLHAEADAVARWRKRIGSSGFKIGLCWQGNPKGPGEPGRSAPLAAFAPLAQAAGARLISLQRTHGLDQLDRLPSGMTVQTLGEDFDAGPDAFIDTAAAIMSLDLVVTGCTAVAHLAGALNRPVWLALQKVPHWVWMMERGDTPWYPSMRLYRQTERDDWSGVFERMQQALREGSGA